MWFSIPFVDINPKLLWILFLIFWFFLISNHFLYNSFFFMQLFCQKNYNHSKVFWNNICLLISFELIGRTFSYNANLGWHGWEHAKQKFEKKNLPIFSSCCLSSFKSNNANFELYSLPFYILCTNISIFVHSYKRFLIY